MVSPAAVIFDYGGVLRGDGRDVWYAADAAGALPPGTLWSAWHDIPEYRLSREGTIDRGAFRAAMLRALAAVAGDAALAEAALAGLETRLAALPSMEPGMRALVERLRTEARVKLGLLSNADRGFTNALRRRRVAQLFDEVVVSGDVGLAKPDPRVFRLAAERLGAPPAACVMIDDQAAHVEGARTAGLRAYRYECGRLDALIAWLEREDVLRSPG
jgi:putative hydrolase of the HAD superfamily